MRARIVFFFILFFLSSYSQAYMYGADLPMAYEIKFRKEKKKSSIQTSRNELPLPVAHESGCMCV